MEDSDDDDNCWVPPSQLTRQLYPPVPTSSESRGPLTLIPPMSPARGAAAAVEAPRAAFAPPSSASPKPPSPSAQVPPPRPVAAASSPPSAPRSLKLAKSAVPKKKQSKLPASQLGGATQYFAAAQKARRSKRKSQVLFSAPKTSRELQALLAQAPPKLHADKKKRLVRQLEQQFPRMWCEMQHGFNILLHGLGSKRAVLNAFAKQAPNLSAPAAVAVCVVNGYEETADAGLVLDELIATYLGWSEERVVMHRRKHAKTWQAQDKCELILTESARLCPLVLVVHSLDTLCRQGGAAILSSLASCAKIHLLASTDHVRTDLLWSQRDADRFNFVWHEACTFAPYDAETQRYAATAIQGGASSRAGRGAAYILKSLTPNHLLILKEMARRQLEKEGKDGIEYRVLLEHCLSNLWINGAGALDMYLSEFVDHELVVKKTSTADGGERLVLTMDNATLNREIVHFGEELEGY